MSDIEITKEAKALLSALYKEYKRRRKAGISKEQARCFGDSDTIQTNIVDKWSINDIDEACRELHSAGILNCFFIDDTVGELELTTLGIAYAESCTKKNISTIISILDRLKALLPW